MNDDVEAATQLLQLVEESYMHGLKLDEAHDVTFWGLVNCLDTEEHTDDDVGECIRLCKNLRHVKVRGPCTNDCGVCGCAAVSQPCEVSDDGWPRPCVAAVRVEPASAGHEPRGAL